MRRIKGRSAKKQNEAGRPAEGSLPTPPEILDLRGRFADLSGSNSCFYHLCATRLAELDLATSLFAVSKLTIR